MNSADQHPALRKQLLLARSDLCRLRIRYDLDTAYGSLRWARAAVTAVRAMPVRCTVLAIAIFVVVNSAARGLRRPK